MTILLRLVLLMAGGADRRLGAGLVGTGRATVAHQAGFIVAMAKEEPSKFRQVVTIACFILAVMIAAAGIGLAIIREILISIEGCNMSRISTTIQSLVLIVLIVICGFQIHNTHRADNYDAWQRARTAAADQDYKQQKEAHAKGMVKWKADNEKTMQANDRLDRLVMRWEKLTDHFETELPEKQPACACGPKCVCEHCKGGRGQCTCGKK